MKIANLILLVLALPLLVPAQSRTLNAFSKISLAEKTFTVTGQFTGYDPAVDSFKYCKVIYNHLYKDNQQNHSGEINAKGQFSIAFPLNRPQEIMFEFNERLVLFYAIPGSSLNIALDLPAFKELEKLPYVEQLKKANPMTFTGQYAQLNKEYNAFRPVLFGILNFKEHYLMIDSLDQTAYKTYRTGKMQAMLDSLTAFNQQGNTSTEFRQLMTQYIRYLAAEDLLRYRWMHGVVKTKRPPVALTPEYLSFLETMPVNNDEALITESYSNFLREYTNYYRTQKANGPIQLEWDQFIPYLRNEGITVSPEDEKILTGEQNSAKGILADSLLKKYKSEFGDYMSQLRLHRVTDSLLSEESAGRGRDLLLTRIISNHLNTFRVPIDEPAIGKLAGNIVDVNLQGQINRENTRLRDVLAGKMPTATQVRSPLAVSSDKFFEELMKPYKGKVVYIDFWAPWCGPCMGEMPNSKELQQELAGKQVVFLYIGMSCTKQSWENTIKDKDIKGEHYFANDNEGKLLSDKFNISGIPHYVLVDKNGKVADERAYRPSDKGKLLKKINGLLKIN